jgi:multiple sugar transport system substrate-binding protein
MKARGMLVMAVTFALLAAAVNLCAEGGKFVFWDKSEYVKTYNDLNKARVEKFAKDNNIEVEYIVVPPNDIKQKLMAAIEAKNPPDLVMTDDFMAKQFSDMGQLADVSDVMKAVPFLQSARDMAYVKSGQYIVPLSFLAPGLYLRSDKFAAAGLKYPTTWAELKEAAKKLNDPANGFYALGLPMGASGGGDAEGMMRAIILDFGGVPVDVSGKVTINSKETLEALKYISSIYNEKLAPPSALTWDDSGNNTAYLAGSVAVVMNSPSVFAAAKKDKPELYANTVITAWPAGPKGRFIPSGGNVFAIFKNGKNNAAAKKYVTEFFKKDFYEDLVIQMGGMWQPTVEGMDGNAFWKLPANKGWLDASKSIVPTTYPAQADAVTARAFSEQLCVKAVQKIVLRGTDPQKALNELESDFKRVLGK